MATKSIRKSLVETQRNLPLTAALPAGAHLQEESALYCPSGGKTPAGAADGLVFHWRHGAYRNIKKISK